MTDQDISEGNMVSSTTSAPSKSDDIKQDCRLMLLPRELRDEIFSFVVLQDGAVTYSSTSTIPRSPPITHTSRQTRHESLPLYFKLNRFIFGYRVTFPRIPKGIKHKRHIEIDF